MSQHELRNVGVLYGPAFREGYANPLPSGTIDVLPTFLHLLGYPIPATVEGRVLYETLAHPGTVPDLAPVTHTATAESLTAAGRYRQHLTTTRMGHTTYVERGWAE